MALTPYACENCGFWQRHFAPPPDCPVCTDVRNDLPEDGWSFLPASEAEARYEGTVREVAPGFYEARTTPALGLAGAGWLTVREGTNCAFEGAPYYSGAMLDAIEELGGVQRLSGSHAHGYGALWQLQDRFAPDVLAIQKDDLAMTKAFRVTRPYDDTLTLAPGMTLHHVGGHYEGQAVLHDEEAGRLFAGDVFKIDQHEDGSVRAISCHKAFHKQIPMTEGELRRYRDVLAPLDFVEVCTPFERAPDMDRALCLAFLDHALANPPSAAPVEVSRL
jgi:hypothetical protein